jgi:hypothetical protein
MPLEINRAPVLTLWAAVVAERLGHPADTALTLGRPLAGSAGRVKARNIGREEHKADRDADRPACGRMPPASHRGERRMPPMVAFTVASLLLPITRFRERPRHSARSTTGPVISR